MTSKELKDKQASMSNEALIGFAEDQITDLAKTGGRSHKMCVPPEITDTDMLFSELVRRYKELLNTKNTVYQFSYNSDCCESTAKTMSLHLTKKGAEMAMEFHKNEIKKEHNELYGDKHKADFEWDFDQWWGTDEMTLNE